MLRVGLMLFSVCLGDLKFGSKESPKLFAALLLLHFAVTTCSAQLEQTQSGSGTSGSTISNDLVKCMNLVGQSGGVFRSENRSLQNYAGFLAGVMLKPELDSDGDGLSDEMDGDNDADGMKDGDELIADTNPASSNSVLAITRATANDSGVLVEWRGGVVARQRLIRKQDLTDESENWVTVFTTNPPTATELSIQDMVATNFPYFYRITAERP